VEASFSLPDLMLFLSGQRRISQLRKGHLLILPFNLITIIESGDLTADILIPYDSNFQRIGSLK